MHRTHCTITIGLILSVAAGVVCLPSRGAESRLGASSARRDVARVPIENRGSFLVGATDGVRRLPSLGDEAPKSSVRPAGNDPGGPALRGPAPSGPALRGASPTPRQTAEPRGVPAAAAAKAPEGSSALPPIRFAQLESARGPQPIVDAAEPSGPPPATGRVRVPVGDPDIADRVQISGHDDRISLTMRDAPLNAVLGLLAEQHQLNIIASDAITQKISATLTDVRLEEALDAILSIHGYTWSRQNNIILVTELAGENKGSSLMQGQVVQVFCLNYVSSLDVDKVVQGLLSPAGQSYTNQTSPQEARRSSEQIVVQDLPSYVHRVAEFIAQVDRPPRQVEVEAHVLQVNLKNDTVHGVNFTALARIAKADVTWETVGLASPGATSASFLRVAGTDLKSLIEVLKTTTDAKTLASPKLTVINGQDGKIQIGSKLGYQTLTTTQTSTLQNVQFLDTGVILKVTPIITQDGQVLMRVNPSISDGSVSPDTGLPNSNTTEVDTKVLLADGEAIVLGGLIRESDDEIVSKIPYLGDVKYLGFFFRHRALKRTRSEIIITLLPRIVPDAPGCRTLDYEAVERAATPLTFGPLNRVDRTEWEPEIAKDVLPWRCWPWDASAPATSTAQPAVEAAPSGRPADASSAPEPIPTPPAAAPMARTSSRTRGRK